jgi:tRNA(fMet)-specific endonuclease VapC
VTEIVLDTDVFSQVHDNRPEARRIEDHLAGASWLLAFPSVAELHFGARKGGWGATRVDRLEEDIGLLAVLPTNDELLRLCGRLRADAVRIGHPLGEQRHANDLWIAACAVHYEVPLLTGNGRHFAGLPGLRLVGG